MSDNYSDWLIVSDIDGTLNNKLRQLPKNNARKIREYVGNGGVFTLCSGRNLQSLTPHYKKLSIETPAIFLNGAGIFDFKTKKILHFKGHTPKGEEEIIKLANQIKNVSVSVFTENMIYHVKPSIQNKLMSWVDNLDNTVCNSFDEVPRGNWGKVIFFGTPSSIKNIVNHFKTDEFKDVCNAFKTSPFSVDVTEKSVTKGEAVLKLSELLNVKNENLCAIGDYYNDVSMLKAVGHPAACGQAPEKVKSLAEYVTCHCNKGAVADFINYLENKYIKNNNQEG